MKIDFRHFPHPVLSHFSPEDLNGDVYQTDINIFARKSVYRFEVKFMTDNRTLLDLVAEKKAFYAIHLECRSTRTRKMFTSFDDKREFTLPTDELDGHVQLCSLILAAEEIPNYQNSSAHPDYGDTAFQVMKGDVLAVAPDQTFSVQKEDDPLKQVPSIFTVSVNDERGAPSFDFNAVDDKVDVILSRENFDLYNQLSQGQDYWPILSSIFVVPVLTVLLEKMRDTDFHEDNGDRRWFIILMSKLDELGVDITTDGPSSVELAQKLIGDPSILALKNLETLGKEEEQED